MARQLGLNLDTSSLQKSWNPRQETIDETKESDNLGGFDCNICLDTVQDPVITLCGHLYCWPCIYKWIHHQSQPSETSENQEPKCPVCKSEVSEKTIIPLYGPGLTPKPSSDKNGPNHGIAIPQRPPTPRTPSFHHIGPIYHQTLNLNDNLGSRITNLNHHHLPPRPHHHPPPPAGGMFGEMVYSRMFGDSGTTMMAYPNSYNLGVSASPRVRRQIKEVDKSLSRLCFFMFCCLVLCLLLF